MPSEVVFKPVEKISKSYQGYVEPTKYFPTYIEWLQKNSVRKSFNDYQDAGSSPSINILETIIPESEVLFITSITLEIAYGVNYATGGEVYLKLDKSDDKIAVLFLDSVNNAAVPLVTTKTFNPPLQINGLDAIRFFVASEMRGAFDIQGFSIQKINLQ